MAERKMIECPICPRGCVLGEGETGNCRIRRNVGGEITLLTYGRPCALHVDPVEKKPLFHFLPGSRTFSLATAGCNLHCRNCQNWSISQATPDKVPAYDLPPGKVPAAAAKFDCASVAYTYTEPIVYYEYTRDSAAACREAGLKNLMITAGYINKAPLRELCRHIDAANVDLKAFSDDFYRDVCKASLKPVLDALVVTREEGVHLEVTNLVIPTLNDDPGSIGKMVRWLVDNLGPNTPLHFSRFHPDYRMKNLPPTPAATLRDSRKAALDGGLQYVYIGNLRTDDGEDTMCPECGKLLVHRVGFTVRENVLKDGACPGCGTAVHGVWR